VRKTHPTLACNDIKTFAAGIRNLEAQPNKFTIHGQPRKPIIPGQQINRRKHENDAKAPPSILPHATLPFFGVDIDNLGKVQKQPFKVTPKMSHFFTMP
jgi:hypothetical protein